MQRNCITEFSKIYRRLLNIEISLKDNFFNVMKKVHNDKLFFRIIPYVKILIKSTRYQYSKSKNGITYTCDFLEDILQSKNCDDDKLKQTLNKLYLKDFLGMLTDYKMVYKNPNFKKCFYHVIPNFDELKKYAAGLCHLRNAIMHFNFSDFEKNRKHYICTLNYWEQKIHCRNTFIHNLPSIQPTVKNILNIIKIHYPEIFSGYDRDLCDMYDDIAIINGLPIDDLPQYWSILRQKYILKSAKDKQMTEYAEQTQLSIFKNI